MNNGNGKSHEKTLPPHLVPGNPGNAGGKKGRSGRRPFAITEAAQQAVNKHKLLEVAAKIALTAEKDSDRLAAIKLLLDRGYGAPTQMVEHSGGVEINVHELRDTFASRIDRVATRVGTPSIFAERN